MAQWVKDAVSSLQWLWSLLWHRFDPWPGNFHTLQAWPKNQQTKQKIVHSPTTVAYKYTFDFFFFFGTKNKSFKLTTYQKDFLGAGENGIDRELLSYIYTHDGFSALVFNPTQRGFVGRDSFFCLFIPQLIL